MNRRQRIIVSITGITLVLLILVGLTYGYFLTRIQGNSNSKSISATTANLEVIYQEESRDVITGEKIVPGATFTKTFSVKNTGDGAANYSIMLDEIESNFVRFIDWTYKLYKGTSASGDPIVSGIIGHNDKQTIKSYETVTPDTPNSYTLVVTYENVNEDQSIDMNKNLSLRVNIDKPIGTELVNAEEGTLLKAIGKNNNVTESLTIPGKEASGLIKGVMGESISEMIISSAYQGYYWTYADGYEYDISTEKYELTGVKTGIYNEIYNNELVGKYLVSSSVYSNCSSSNRQMTTDNLSQIYQVVSAESGKLTYKTSIKEFEEAELSYSDDDYGTSYYYRGNVNNNYVQFANMCWRIVRIEGDGSIKLILASEKTCNNVNVTNNSGYATDGTDGEGTIINAYYGYECINGDCTQGNSKVCDYIKSTGDSSGSARTQLNAWLERKKINTSRLKSDNWCIGDLKNAYSTSNWSDEIIGNIQEMHKGSSDFDYAAKKRLSLGIPKLKCETTGTDGEIDDNKIGMLTTDEIAFAGGGESTINSNYYLNQNSTLNMWWTLSPARFFYDIGHETHSANVTKGKIDTNYPVDTSMSIRPSIVLVSDTKLSNGNGTIDDPFVIDN